MTEERGATIIGGIEAEIRALRQDVTGLKVDVGILKTGFEQMGKPVSKIERAVTQIQWSLVSGFSIAILAVILTRLLR